MTDESYVDYVTIGGTKRKLRDSVSRDLCQKAADNAKAEVDELYAADRESWAEQVDAAATTARNAADTARAAAAGAIEAASKLGDFYFRSEADGIHVYKREA